MKTLTGLFGKTRQAYYKQINFQSALIIDEAIVLEIVNRKRKQMKTKRWGGRKLLKLIEGDLQNHGIEMGRDKFFDLLRANNLLVKPRKRNFFTTQSHHWLRKYDYLIEDLELNAPNQLWVSDITYIESAQHPLYLFLITDAYSQKIVGWHIALDLKADSAVTALKMALRQNRKALNKKHQLIHHSDRGVQYCSTKYVSLLEQNSIKISMTLPASPQQNSIAERINGIIKNEWIYDMKLDSCSTAQKELKEIIRIYNEHRPHQTLEFATPNDIHTEVLIRHQVKRVIGKTYPKKRLCLKKNTVQRYRPSIIPGRLLLSRAHFRFIEAKQ